MAFKLQIKRKLVCLANYSVPDTTEVCSDRKNKDKNLKITDNCVTLDNERTLHSISQSKQGLLTITQYYL